jgi:1,4-alpha-glucan branching enzyme
MGRGVDDPVIDRGIALHKMIRFASLTMGGEGYLNFMGNEFGHPEWIDFPREGNGWSYFYCRRQWSLADRPDLKYSDLLRFDGAMIALSRKYDFLRKPPRALFIDEYAQIITFERAGLTFVFNFSPDRSYPDYWVTVPKQGNYSVVFSTDESRFGGWDRIATDTRYRTSLHPDGKNKLQVYLPARTALVLRRVR